MRGQCVANVATYVYPRSQSATILEVMSTTYKLNGGILSIYIKQDDVLMKTLPYILASHADYFKEGYTKSMLMSSPVSTSLVFVTETLRIIIPEVYFYNSSLDMIHARVYLIRPNLYGNDSADLLFVFDMTRKLGNKINWRHFELRNIWRVFPNCQTSGWALRAIAAENMK